MNKQARILPEDIFPELIGYVPPPAPAGRVRLNNQTGIDSAVLDRVLEFAAGVNGVDDVAVRVAYTALRRPKLSWRKQRPGNHGFAHHGPAQESGWVSLVVPKWMVDCAMGHENAEDVAAQIVDTAIHEMAHISDQRRGVLRPLSEYAGYRPGSTRRIPRRLRPCEIAAKAKVAAVKRDMLLSDWRAAMIGELIPALEAVHARRGSP